jgi:two-component sensor histidine kinase
MRGSQALTLYSKTKSEPLKNFSVGLPQSFWQHRKIVISVVGSCKTPRVNRLQSGGGRAVGIGESSDFTRSSYMRCRKLPPKLGERGECVVAASRLNVERLDARGRTYRWRGDAGDVATASTHRLTSRIEQLEEEIVLRQLLLEEIIHRTKNALQLVIAALWEQANSRSDTRVRRTVLGIEKQVLTPARAHNQFYGPGAPNALIRIAEICESIRDTFGERARQVALALNVAEIPLQRHQQICLRLILYELLTNAFKHAFPYGTNAGVDHDRAERRRFFGLSPRHQR